MMGNVTVVNNYSFSSYEEQMRSYASLNGVPIIKDEGLYFLIENIKKYNVKNILEIGTAIGYSASIMVKCNNAKVTTIERDPKMYNEAIKNIKNQNLTNKIRVVYADALEAYPMVSDQKYDLIFIDAAKGQYQKFFQMYSRLLNNNGIIICDNMDFHDLVFKDVSTLTRGARGIVTKLKRFKNFLDTNDDFVTTYYHIGDGMTISYPKEICLSKLINFYYSKNYIKFEANEYDLYENDFERIYVVYFNIDKILKESNHNKKVFLLSKEKQNDFEFKNCREKHFLVDKKTNQFQLLDSTIDNSNDNYLIFNYYCYEI